MNTTLENWKPIKELEGIYHISDHGRVKSFKVHKTDGKLIRPKRVNKVYLQYVIKHNGKQVTFYAHRKVAEYFLPNPNNFATVDHINNNDKSNNHISNLQWLDLRENVCKDQAHDIQCTDPQGNVTVVKGTRLAAELAGCKRASVQYAIKHGNANRSGWFFKIIK